MQIVPQLQPHVQERNGGIFFDLLERMRQAQSAPKEGVNNPIIRKILQ